ncbi:MAG TPA: HAD family phosphatase, partial [Spirochaetota bacterium]|nr:HAD family phosphatase [Spirochaetota bacterium]
MGKKQYRAILFDNDGVLIDTEHLYYRANREVLRSAGIDLSEEMFVEYFLRQGEGLWKLLPQANFSPDEVQGFRDERNRIYFSFLEKTGGLIEGVMETLLTLRRRCTMGIVTSCRKSHFDAMHARTDIIPLFDFILTRESYEHSKPHPEPYLMALEKAGVAAEDAVVVEDSERGLTAAKAAGIDCIV